MADPDLILPEEALRIPGQRALTPEELEAQRVDVADMRERLDDLEEANRQAAEAGWGFFNPIAVGAGPPEPGETESREEVAPAPAEDAPVDLVPDDRGALRQGDDRSGAEVSDDDEAELSALILSSLVGWRRSSGAPSAQGRDKWLRFDADTGRFA